MTQAVRKHSTPESSASGLFNQAREELSLKSSQEYNDLLAKLQDLPTLPVIAMKVNELINDPNTRSEDIAQVLKQDQVLTAKILRLVNSSFYAVPGGVSDVQKALAFLGFNTVAQLVLSLSVFSMFSKFSDEDISMKDFWMHALGAAICGEAISKKFKIGRPEETFTCGLLHDIGKLVMHIIDPKRLEYILGQSKENKTGFIDIERKHDMLTHAYIGEMMAMKWNLPQVVRQSIRYHHSDVEKLSTILPSAKKTIQTVRLANAMAVKNKIGKSGDHSVGTITKDMLEPLGLKPEQIEEIEKDLPKLMEKAGAFLNAGT